MSHKKPKLFFYVKLGFPVINGKMVRKNITRFRENFLPAYITIDGRVYDCNERELV